MDKNDKRTTIIEFKDIQIEYKRFHMGRF